MWTRFFHIKLNLKGLDLEKYSLILLINVNAHYVYYVHFINLCVSMIDRLRLGCQFTRDMDCPSFSLPRCVIYYFTIPWPKVPLLKREYGIFGPGVVKNSITLYGSKIGQPTSRVCHHRLWLLWQCTRDMDCPNFFLPIGA